MKRISYWIEAMRLRTLPVSVAGVLTAIALAKMSGAINWLPAILCLIFAILAQIASNFANEYYDFKAGLDKPGREGPRRGVTEGDITPQAMRNATFVTLAIACAIGCSLIAFAGWWLIIVGALIAVGVIAYSTGPYPLSHHGLGEVAVILFFGLIPVNFTYYLVTGEWNDETLCASIAIGLMGSNVLIVNNYRDTDADAAVGKHTLAVIWGRRACQWLYAFNGVIAVALTYLAFKPLTITLCVISAIYLGVHTMLTISLGRLNGRKLTPILGMTAMLMLLFAIGMLALSFTH